MSNDRFPAYTLADLPTAELSRAAFRTVNSEESVERAREIMVADEISQVPVLNEARDVVGAITWRSLARRGDQTSIGSNYTNSHQTAGDALESIPGKQTFALTTPILEILDIVFLHDYVLTHDEAHTPCGIITASDITRCATAFLAIGEIERYLQTALANVDDSVIDDALGGSNSSRPRQWFFIDYCRVLGQRQDAVWRNLPDEGLWKRIKPNNREEFETRLEEVRHARNRASHFRPEERDIRDSDADLLKKFARCLRIISGSRRRAD